MEEPDCEDAVVSRIIAPQSVLIPPVSALISTAKEN